MIIIIIIVIIIIIIFIVIKHHHYHLQHLIRWPQWGSEGGSLQWFQYTNRNHCHRCSHRLPHLPLHQAGGQLSIVVNLGGGGRRSKLHLSTAKPAGLFTPYLEKIFFGFVSG